MLGTGLSRRVTLSMPSWISKSPLHDAHARTISCSMARRASCSRETSRMVGSAAQPRMASRSRCMHMQQQ